MKKTLIALMALAGVASADYVWNGPSGSITSTQWGDKSNWTFTNGSSWNNNSVTGPNTDAMYDANIVVNQSITLSGFRIEGYLPKFTVTNNSTFTATFVKFQGPAVIDVDSGSTFNLTIDGDYKDNTATFTVDGTLNLDATDDNGWCTTTFTLGNNGSLSISNANNCASSVTLNATLQGSEAGSIYTRSLLTYSNASLTNVAYNFGEGWTDVGEGEITGAKQYKITNDANGISVNYMAVAPIPEPTTATLSLLALAGLAARRRRR